MSKLIEIRNAKKNIFTTIGSIVYGFACIADGLVSILSLSLLISSFTYNYSLWASLSCSRGKTSILYRSK